MTLFNPFHQLVPHGHGDIFITWYVCDLRRLKEDQEGQKKTAESTMTQDCFVFCHISYFAFVLDVLTGGWGGTRP